MLVKLRKPTNLLISCHERTAIAGKGICAIQGQQKSKITLPVGPEIFIQVQPFQYVHRPVVQWQ